ncbi:hypothetical protein CDL15_Pgr027916 [Punica granatum]|uniref:Uncharacterized protein n=1 Tax=Punica granatum TaxID=22663 RepID=A0A218XKB7_PUNGR|nr:hypothetical protein CDL15_Pgr027916 [Punica granatum]
MEGSISRKDMFRAESKYWNDIIDSYVRVYHWGDLQLRNVMDMRAGFGLEVASTLCQFYKTVDLSESCMTVVKFGEDVILNF